MCLKHQIFYQGTKSIDKTTKRMKTILIKVKITDFFAFFEVQAAMVVEFYRVIHVMKGAQEMRLTNV